MRALIVLLALWCATLPAMAEPIADSSHWKALDESESIDVEGLRRADEEFGAKLTIYDARSRQSYEQGHIRGAKLPLTPEFYKEQELFRLRVTNTPPDMDEALRRATDGADRSAPIVTYCDAECGASKVLLHKLKALGFTDVRALQGGYQAWEEAGLPVSGSAVGGSSR